ncbi:hypothetical protein DPMN_174648 [Dreissena polymorpha]|uniref:Uncharacterized protein n=1 Tax=Dreissena polymorpha TaxID=45954 RepID=A0A9D4E3R1_DREPO|nr:hypothetical protein DPMN_174648 [Dreissena polymorpha]
MRQTGDRCLQHTISTHFNERLALLQPKALGKASATSYDFRRLQLSEESLNLQHNSTEIEGERER